MLQAKRQKEKERDDYAEFSLLESVQAAYTPCKASSRRRGKEEDLSLEAFQSAVSLSNSSDKDTECDDFDGYALRDLLMSRWGAPLDVGRFQRQPGPSVYCSVLPVAYGSSKCQHATELEYLMHLQSVIEILRKYKNLHLFIEFLQTTTKTPKPGTDSVPFRLQLTTEQIAIIL